jgi:hypothetical protein
MNAVILTFPGHFFQTQLCVKSLLMHYPEIERIFFLLDDVQADPWQTYRDDFIQCMDGLVAVPWQMMCSSQLPKIRDCVAGWWRQQLIKFTLDQIVPGDNWFVVDGDVVFYSRCDIADRVPISRRYDGSSRWSKMCELYVKGVLGIDHGLMHDQDQAVITSPIPFRYLDAGLLSSLRQHVESRFGQEFLDLHLAWFADQTIVADIDPPTRWVMSEWELIECYRRFVQGDVLEFEDLGSGYQIGSVDAVMDDRAGIFVHSYQRDTEIKLTWFQEQGLEIDDAIWTRNQDWYMAREVRRLV